MRSFAAVRFPGVLRDNADASGATARVRMSRAASTSANVAEAELRFVEGVRGIKSQAVRMGRAAGDDGQSKPAQDGSGAASAARDAKLPSKKRLFVVRAREVATDGSGSTPTDTRPEKVVRKSWVGEIVGEVVEDHSFSHTMDALWPEGCDAWRPSLSSRRSAAQQAPENASAPADSLPKVVADSVFGTTVLSEFDVTALKQRRKVQQ